MVGEDCYLYSINEKLSQVVVEENEDVAAKDDATEKERELEEMRNLRKRIPKVHSENDFEIEQRIRRKYKFFSNTDFR